MQRARRRLALSSIGSGTDRAGAGALKRPWRRRLELLNERSLPLPELSPALSGRKPVQQSPRRTIPPVECHGLFEVLHRSLLVAPLEFGLAHQHVHIGGFWEKLRGASAVITAREQSARATSWPPSNVGWTTVCV